MKRYIVFGFLVIVLLVIAQMAMNHQAKANMLAALVAYGQAETHYGRIIRPSPGEPLLVRGQIKIFTDGRRSLQYDIAWAESQAAGFHVPTESGMRVPVEDWIAWANVEIAVLSQFIADLESLQ